MRYFAILLASIALITPANAGLFGRVKKSTVKTTTPDGKVTTVENLESKNREKLLHRVQAWETTERKVETAKDGKSRVITEKQTLAK